MCARGKRERWKPEDTSPVIRLLQKILKKVTSLVLAFSTVEEFVILRSKVIESPRTLGAGQEGAETPKLPRWIDKPTATKEFGVSGRTLDRLVAQGYVRSYKSSDARQARRVYRASDIETTMDLMAGGELPPRGKGGPKR